jgi:hypothetical protein
MHISALQGINPDNLRLGERLTFDVEKGRSERKDQGRKRSPAGEGVKK